MKDHEELLREAVGKEAYVEFDSDLSGNAQIFEVTDDKVKLQFIDNVQPFYSSQVYPPEIYNEPSEYPLGSLTYCSDPQNVSEEEATRRRTKAVAYDEPIFERYRQMKMETAPADVEHFSDYARFVIQPALDKKPSEFSVEKLTDITDVIMQNASKYAGSLTARPGADDGFTIDLMDGKELVSSTSIKVIIPETYRDRALPNGDRVCDLHHYNWGLYRNLEQSAQEKLGAEFADGLEGLSSSETLEQ